MLIESLNQGGRGGDAGSKRKGLRRPVLGDDDDSVDPKVNYATENQVDMFEDFDAGALDALTQMQQGISSRGFRLLAYIIVNFLCEAVKCPRSIDAIRARHQDIFTWLPIRHLAYTIVLLEHSVNR